MKILTLIGFAILIAFVIISGLLGSITDSMSLNDSISRKTSLIKPIDNRVVKSGGIQ